MRRKAIAVAGAAAALSGLWVWGLRGRAEPEILVRAHKLVQRRSAKPPFASYAWTGGHTIYFMDQRNWQVHRLDANSQTDVIDARLTDALSKKRWWNGVAGSSPDGKWLAFTFACDAAHGSSRYGVVGWTLVTTDGGRACSYVLDPGGGTSFAGQPLWRRDSSIFAVATYAHPDNGYWNRILLVNPHSGSAVPRSFVPGPGYGQELLGQSPDGLLIFGKDGGAIGPNNVPQFTMQTAVAGSAWQPVPTRYPQRCTGLTRVLCAVSPDGKRVLWLFQEESRLARQGWLDRILATLHLPRVNWPLTLPRIVLWTSDVNGSNPVEIGTYPMRMVQNLQPIMQGLQAKWTPDSRNISFVHDGDFYVVPAK